MRQSPWLEIRKQLFLKTDDDWFPNYPGDRALVTLSEAWHPRKPEQYLLHLTVFGAKDFGLHRWVKADEYNFVAKRRKLLLDIEEFPRPLNINWLLKNKFRYC